VSYDARVDVKPWHLVVGLFVAVVVGGFVYLVRAGRAK
jgi:hypothetical protein